METGECEGIKMCGDTERRNMATRISEISLTEY
jgi:hypothetical protein